MNAPANQFAIAARLTKAHKLASHLHRHSITAEEAKLMTAEEWHFLARKTGVKWDMRRSRAETIEVTIQMLGDLEHYGDPDGPADGGEHDWNTEAADLAYRRQMMDAGRERLLG